MPAPKVNYFLNLGLNETAEESAIDAAYRHLYASLNVAKFIGNQKAIQQAADIFARIGKAYGALKDPEFRESHRAELAGQGEPFTPDQLKPFLGHVCVAAGIITYEDLMEAISRQTNIDLPLGQILQERGLLSQTELEGMLMGQKLYSAPARPLEPMVKRLLSLEMITIDMIKIALIDQRASMAGLSELLSRRGWIEKSVIDALK